MPKQTLKKCAHDRCRSCNILHVYLYAQTAADACNKCTWRNMFILITGKPENPQLELHAWDKDSAGSEISSVYLCWSLKSHLLKAKSHQYLLLAHLHCHFHLLLHLSIHHQKSLAQSLSSLWMICLLVLCIKQTQMIRRFRAQNTRGIRAISQNLAPNFHKIAPVRKYWSIWKNALKELLLEDFA